MVLQKNQFTRVHLHVSISKIVTSCKVRAMKSNRNVAHAKVRVLETAWEMISEQSDASISLVDVAKRAGVSRQTVYVNFGSRAGLLNAMVEYKQETAPELVRLKTGRPSAIPEKALADFVKAWFAGIPVVFKVARALTAAGETDLDARAAIESRWQLLRAGCLATATALHQAGKLAPQWTPDTAADWFYHLIHVDTWQHLVIERGWPAAKVVDQTIETLIKTLCVEPPVKPPMKPTKSIKKTP